MHRPSWCAFEISKRKQSGKKIAYQCTQIHRCRRKNTATNNKFFFIHSKVLRIKARKKSANKNVFNLFLESLFVCGSQSNIHIPIFFRFANSFLFLGFGFPSANSTPNSYDNARTLRHWDYSVECSNMGNHAHLIKPNNTK